MCQLLAMNCNVPTDICFSFSGFRARGGLTDAHKDGWGIAFFEGRGVRQFLDPLPSAHSPIADLVRNYPIKSKNVIAHIRRATQGEVALENTHPFLRELWGRYWIFAHNGNITNFSPVLQGQFLPVGRTDSERVFCWMMQSLKEKFGDMIPSNEQLFGAIQEMTKQVGTEGEFNFILSNGDTLIAHASTNLHYVIRKAPFPRAVLKDEDLAVDLSSVTTANDRVAVIATLPLTQNEEWTRMEPGTLWMFEEGGVVDQKATVKGPAEKMLPWTGVEALRS